MVLPGQKNLDEIGEYQKPGSLTIGLMPQHRYCDERFVRRFASLDEIAIQYAIGNPLKVVSVNLRTFDS